MVDLTASLTQIFDWIESLSCVITTPSDGFSGLEVSETLTSLKAGSNYNRKVVSFTPKVHIECIAAYPHTKPKRWH